jgi:hypothetical protein
MCGRRTISFTRCTQQEYFAPHREKEHLQIGRISVIKAASIPIPSPGLGPEKAISYEIGPRFHNEQWRVNLSA